MILLMQYQLNIRFNNNAWKGFVQNRASSEEKKPIVESAFYLGQVQVTDVY